MAWDEIWNKAIKHCVEGPLGFPMSEESARAVEEAIKANPTGKEFEYRRVGVTKAPSEIKEESRSEVSIVSTDSVDRDREVIMPKGLDLDHFRANPIVPMAHDYRQLPVGRAKWIKHVKTDKESGRFATKAETEYAKRPAEWRGDWLPDAIWSMTKDGIVKGKSIGFLPLEGRAPSEDDIKSRPEMKDVQFIFTKGILLEYSVAPVPSNPDALVQLVAKGAIGKSVCDALGFELPATEEPESDKGEEEPKPEVVTLTKEEYEELKAAAAKAVEEKVEADQDDDSNDDTPENHKTQSFVSEDEYNRAVQDNVNKILANVDFDKIAQERLEVARGQI